MSPSLEFASDYTAAWDQRSRMVFGCKLERGAKWLTGSMTFYDRAYNYTLFVKGSLNKAYADVDKIDEAMSR